MSMCEHEKKATSDKNKDICEDLTFDFIVY